VARCNGWPNNSRVDDPQPDYAHDRQLYAGPTCIVTFLETLRVPVMRTALALLNLVSLLRTFTTEGCAIVHVTEVAIRIVRTLRY